MSERGYTVKELDALRYAVGLRWSFGTTVIPERGMVGRCTNEVERSKCVEELVRAHMIAGHTAEDIYSADREQAEQSRNSRGEK